MDNLKKLIDFLDKLEKAKIHYKLNKVRDAIMVEINVPGERWEIEFMDPETWGDGAIQVEKYICEGEMRDEKELEVLFRDFSD